MLIRALIVTAAVAVAGCASVPDREAVESVSEARASIEQADRVDVDAAQGGVLAGARDKLDAAQAALDSGEERRAIRLAEEAKADAAYAVAAARAEQAQLAVAEVQETIRTLQTEIAP